jgi:hypothetical protein
MLYQWEFRHKDVPDLLDRIGHLLLRGPRRKVKILLRSQYFSSLGAGWQNPGHRQDRRKFSYYCLNGSFLFGELTCLEKSVAFRVWSNPEISNRNAIQAF